MKNRLLIILSLLQVAVISTTFSQSVSINTTGNAADTSAILDITSVSKGILIPRMSQAQKLAIFQPAAGLLIYQLDGVAGFYFYNAALGWKLLAGASGSAGISSLNGLTDADQTLFIGASGTTPAWNSGAGAHTLNIPRASVAGVTAGLISNTDWNIFNNKQAALTTGSLTSADLAVSGGNGAVIGNGVTLNLAPSGVAAGTYNSVVVNSKGIVTSGTNSGYVAKTDFSAVAPLAYNSTSGTFSIAKATATTDGYLASTDFSTFNNKLGSVSLTGDGVIHPSTTFTVTNGAATGALTLNTQSPNRFLAGPASGTPSVAPTFRAIVAADLPKATTSAIGGISVGTGLSVNAAGVLTTTGAAPTGTAGGDLTGTYPNPTLASTGVATGSYGTTAGTSYPIITVDSKGRITSATSQPITFPSAITSLNGLTASTQTFATPGIAGTAPAWLSSGSIHTLNIPLASATDVTAGLLSNADYNAFKATTATAWLTTGNTGTDYATSFLGTTDNRSLSIRTNSIKRMILDSIGNVAIGTDTFDVTNPERFLVNAGTTNSVTGLMVKGSINNYFQMNIKNFSSGPAATTDIVATADNGSETTNYVDLGINGSAYTGSAIETGKANDGYLISSGNDFYMVNSSPNKAMLFLTGGTGVANERMRILANGFVGMGVQDPTSQFVVKDTMEIRRTGTMSQLLFTKTSGTGDFRIGGDGGDLYWQGGGGRALQMGSYWTTILGGDRQNSAYPAFISNLGGTGVLVQGQRDASVPLGIQANSATQSSNLTEWRNSTGSTLSSVNKSGFFGIGTSNPATALHVVAANPLTLMGVSAGTNTIADSILTITSGLVRKLPVSTFATTTNSWSTIGNSVATTSSDFLGTTNNASLRFRTSNIQRLILDSLGSLGVGPSPTFTAGVNREQLLVDAGVTNSINAIAGKGSIDSYLQLNIQNLSSGVNASSDVVATANNGSEINNYVDMGVNGGGYSGGVMGAANDAYLYNLGQNLLIGTGTPARALVFMTGGTSQATNERMRIDGSGNVGIGTVSPAQRLDVNGNINTSGNLTALGTLTTDQGSTNTGTLLPGLQLGGSTSGEVISSKRTTGTNQYGIDFYTASANRMSITNGGNIGIGTTTPTTKLQVFATTNPLSLLGVQTGVNTDSLLTITSGVVRKLSPTALATNGWSLTGNTGSASSLLGTTGAFDLPIITNNTTQMTVTSAGNVGIGSTGFDPDNPEKLLVDAGETASSTILNASGSKNGYLQLNVQNTNNGASASTDIVATANNGTNNSAYIDMGINSNGYASTSTNILNGSNTAYLYSNASDFYIGNGAINKALVFFTNSNLASDTTANGTERMRINASGNVGVSTNSPNSSLDVNGSFGNAIMTINNNGSNTLGAANYTVIIPPGGTPSIALPSAATSIRRIYIIVNQSSASRTVNSYQNFSNTTTSTIAANSSITIQSNGANWVRIQ